LLARNQKASGKYVGLVKHAIINRLMLAIAYAATAVALGKICVHKNRGGGFWLSMSLLVPVVIFFRRLTGKRELFDPYAKHSPSSQVVE